jgi:hypothetical protein
MGRPAATPYECLTNEHQSVIPDRALGALKWYLRLTVSPVQESRCRGFEGLFGLAQKPCSGEAASTFRDYCFPWDRRWTGRVPSRSRTRVRGLLVTLHTFFARSSGAWSLKILDKKDQWGRTGRDIEKAEKCHPPHKHRYAPVTDPRSVSPLYRKAVCYYTHDSTPKLGAAVRGELAIA